MKQIHLLTSNSGKIAAANTTFKQFEIEILPLVLDIPEIQAASSQEIANDAARKAFLVTNKPIIREDHSFFIDELGIPGPYMGYMDKKMSVGQLLMILNALSIRSGYFELAAAYINASGSLYEFSYQVPVEFSTVARGDSSQRWNQIIKFKDDSRVFAEYSEAERLPIWSKNYECIARRIKSE
jgi:non-canonical purine NTP pyrophosphatase (RdgB/HAM1 family)